MIAVEVIIPEGMMQTRPRIGIPMRLEQTTNRFYLGRDYSEAVEAAGGIPVHISLIPKPDYIDSVVAQLDGILLPGSDSDVDPLRYGQQPHPQLGTVQTIKDETDLLVIAAAERRRIPIFAICFGMQVLNVSRGGTLIQDINSQVPDAIKHEQGAPRNRRWVPHSRQAPVGNRRAADCSRVVHIRAEHNRGQLGRRTARRGDTCDRH